MLHRNWTTRDGLPQDHIRAIVRTRDGFLWLGTDAGLARFDGFEFKTYGLRDGLGAVAVLSLLEARDGTLWAGTMGGGVSAIREGKVQRTYTREDGLPSESVSRLAEDNEGCLWVTDRAGHARLKDGRFSPAPGSPDEGKTWLTAMHGSRDGTLWVSFPGKGVRTWKDGVWSKPLREFNRATAFCQDSAGRMWAADSRTRLWCLDQGRWQSFPPHHEGRSYVSSLASGPDGTIWAAYFRDGIAGHGPGGYIDPVTRGEPFAGLEEVLHFTPDGQLWLGTSTQGLFALTPSRLEMKLLDSAAANRGANFIGALVEEKPGQFLVGTQGHGLFRLGVGGPEQIIVEPEIGPSVQVNSMVKTGDGYIWVASGAGLARLKDGIKIPLPGKEGLIRDVWELCDDGEGGMWAGLGYGELFHVGSSGPRKESFGSVTSPVKGIAREADGTLWLGTRGNGLFHKQGNTWPKFGTADGLPSEVIRVIFIGKDGTVWVGTAGGGLAVKRGDRFMAVTTEEGLPDDTVSQITEDENGRLWLGTNRGLAVLSKEEVERIKSSPGSEVFPRVIDRFDGLLSEEFTIVPPLATSDGRLAFATTQGFALLQPGDFHADETTSPVFLEEVLLDNQPVAARDGVVEVPPGVMRVEFRFTALHFAAPDRLRFRNRLNGLEEDWGAPGTARSAAYRNVKPGSYRFEVSASTGNGHWSEAPASVVLHFHPHFWQTAWFQGGSIAALLTAVILGVRQRERRRAARRIEELERQQAVDNERARIARDLHDDVGASLTQVALLSQLARSNLTKRPERAGQHVQEIFDTAKEVTRSLDEIVWAVNPANDTLESFALFLGAFVQNYSHAAGLRSRFDVPGVLPTAPLESSVRHHLYLATKEVMHNIAKHAHATEIRLRLALEPGSFHLVIEDDGQGFDTTAPGAPDADGLINLQNRLKQIGGTCTRHSEPGKGTSVEMTVPLTT